MHLVIQMVGEAEDKERGEAKYFDITGEDSRKTIRSTCTQVTVRLKKPICSILVANVYQKGVDASVYKMMWRCYADIKLQSGAQLSIISCKLCIHYQLKLRIGHLTFC